MIAILSFPIHVKAQKDKYDIITDVDCIEYAGDGKIVVYFGYENTGKKTVLVDENGSVVTYNHGQSTPIIAGTPNRV